MELIFGGAYSGKLSYAVKEYGLKADELWDLEKGLPDSVCRAVYHFESYTRRCLDEGLGGREAVKRLLEFIGDDAIIISREVGSGIVPMDASERAWREAHGEALRLICENAERVTRIFFGIAEVLK